MGDFNTEELGYLADGMIECAKVYNHKCGRISMEAFMCGCMISYLISGTLAVSLVVWFSS